MTTKPLYPDARLKAAINAADEAFWAEIAAHFPEVTTGDLGPRAQVQWDRAMRDVAEEWLNLNFPKKATTEEVYRAITTRTLTKLVTYEHPGYIDVHLSDDLVIGFDDSDGFRAIIKDNNAEETVAIIGLNHSDAVLCDADAIALGIIAFCGIMGMTEAPTC